MVNSLAHATCKAVLISLYQGTLPYLLRHCPGLRDNIGKVGNSRSKYIAMVVNEGSNRKYKSHLPTHAPLTDENVVITSVSGFLPPAPSSVLVILHSFLPRAPVTSSWSSHPCQTVRTTATYWLASPWIVCTHDTGKIGRTDGLPMSTS
jgi:hypothetical protein